MRWRGAVEGATLGVSMHHGVPTNTPLFHHVLKREKAERSRDQDFAKASRRMQNHQYSIRLCSTSLTEGWPSDFVRVTPSSILLLASTKLHLLANSSARKLRSFGVRTEPSINDQIVMILIVTLRLKLHNAWTKALTVRIQ